mgnify:CR=1 FL=1
MSRIEYSAVKETMTHTVLKNGLNVYIMPKEGFHKTYATLSTNFGSINTTVSSKDGVKSIPHGIAHFLEHKLFEQNSEDVSKQFALQQASVNAFTQTDRTTYLFSCTDKFEDNLALLLNFVFHPQFTEEGIEKEKSIIEQEIKMYLDNPNTVVYMSMLKNLFKDHPITNEILGTIESINTINQDILEETHKAYYHPKNMMLFVTGNINPEDTIAFLEESCVSEFGEMIPQLPIQNDEMKIFRKNESIEKDVLVPNYLMGILLPSISKEDIMKTELAISVLMDLVLGRSTKAFNDLLSDGLVNDSFGMDISCNESFGYFMIGSESTKPEVLEARLSDILLNIDVDSILKEDFIRTKKQTLGSYIHALNSLEFIANSFTKYYYQNNNLFNLLEVSRELSVNDLKEVQKLFKEKKLYSSFTLNPKKNEK